MTTSPVATGDDTKQEFWHALLWDLSISSLASFTGDKAYSRDKTRVVARFLYFMWYDVVGDKKMLVSMTDLTKYNGEKCILDHVELHIENKDKDMEF